MASLKKVGSEILKVLVNVRGHIIAHVVSWAGQTGKHLLRTQNVSEQNRKHFFRPILCPQQMLHVQANGETFVSATMCHCLPGPLCQ